MKGVWGGFSLFLQKYVDTIHVAVVLGISTIPAALESPEPIRAYFTVKDELNQHRD